MPDKRTHRGQHPADGRLFADRAVGDLRTAVNDFSLLLTKSYAEKSALKLVCDKFALTQRQRLAVMRCSCSDQQLAERKQKEIPIVQAANRLVAIDGYNVLITIEAALSNSFIFKGRDNCLKDIAGIHGTYRKVTETIPAVELIGTFLEESGIANVLWLLDSPVSNSARLKALIAEIANKHNWNWQIELSQNPDKPLSETDSIAATSDGIILDNCKTWLNLAAEIIKQKLTSAEIIDLSTVNQ
ncbi:DUF434 domain-containing protein [Planctomycetota bacterium]